MEPRWVVLVTENGTTWKADGMLYIDELTAHEIMVNTIRTSPKVIAACVREVRECPPHYIGQNSTPAEKPLDGTGGWA